MTSTGTRPRSITTTMTEATILHDNMIKRKIESATEGVSSNYIYDTTWIKRKYSDNMRLYVFHKIRDKPIRSLQEEYYSLTL